MIEVTMVKPRTFFKWNIAIFKIEPSCNDWFDMTIAGKNDDLLGFLKEYMDEGQEYLNENEIK